MSEQTKGEGAGLPSFEISGPWEWVSVHGAEECNAYALLSGPCGSVLIHEAAWQIHPATRALIAAAPDLIAAVKFTLATMDMASQPYNPLEMACRREMSERKLRAALAKAEGSAAQ